MARRHFANALVSSSDVPFEKWMDSIRSQHEGAVPKDHVHRIAKSILHRVDPRQYLLSHATIVASVDTREPVSGAQLGKRTLQGVEIDVRFPNYRIKPEGFEIINNNGDAWERSLLLSTYRTFIGAHNYLEHVQLPELSKGFIVDAVARDLGSTCYIDILVATDRQHTKLINDILSGDLYGLSMGCISLFTICTQCGNVAADDTQVCPCVMQGKGRTFVDEDGVSNPISELIGHVSVPNSNQFIEASWVKAPAFRGAVRRNILNPDSPDIASNVEAAARVYELRRTIDLPEDGRRAASQRRWAEDPEGEMDAPDAPPASDDPPDATDAESPDVDPQDVSADDLDIDSLSGSPGGAPGGSPSPSTGGFDELEDEGEGEGEPAKSDENTTQQLVSEIKKLVLQSIADDLAKEMEPQPADVGEVRATPDFESSGGGNDNLIRSSDEFCRKVRQKFPNNGKICDWAKRTYSLAMARDYGNLTASDLIVLSWIVDHVKDRQFPSVLYKVAMNVGPMRMFPSEISYLAACRMKIGRNLTVPERRFLTWKGKIASLAEF